MTATYTEAIDAMSALFYAAWQAGTTAIVGSVPEIRWQGKELPGKPPMNTFWCRFSTQQLIEPQATLNDVEQPGKKRYTASGLIFVQLFCPMSDAQAMDKGRRLAEVARNAFRGKHTANGVWFRNARINELAPENDAYRFNVIVDYSYDDIG